jgi:hypothetical protein
MLEESTPLIGVWAREGAAPNDLEVVPWPAGSLFWNMGYIRS